MTLPPAIAAVLVLDLLGAAALVVAMAGALGVAAGWNPASASADQLALERTAEEASLTGRVAFALHCAAGFLLVLAVNHVLPSLVPGAMCGQGALESLPGGAALLALRVVALASLYGWATLDAIDRRDEYGPFAAWSARLLLAAGAITLVASVRTAAALLSVDLVHPVSCCAMVVDLARAAASDSTLASAGIFHVLIVTGLGAALVLAFLRPPSSARVAAIVVVATAAWALLAEWVLVDVAAPYHYGLLGHRCPFCLFLPEQHLIGYLLHGTALGALLASVRLAVAQHALRQVPRAARHTKQDGRWGAAAILLHLGASFLPVAGHWIATGTSITGSAP